VENAREYYGYECNNKSFLKKKKKNILSNKIPVKANSAPRRAASKRYWPANKIQDKAKISTSFA
jgi:hypothetical protein